MRKTIYGAAVSLDGYIAAPNDEIDWLRWSDDVAALSAAMFESADTVLMGRKTYEAALRAGLRSYPGVRNVVYSRSLDASQYPQVEVIADDAVEHVRALKAGDGADIIVMGGGEIARSLLRAELIDEVGVNIQPVVLGGGVPLLPEIGRRVGLELIESRVLSGDCVYVMYRVKRAGG